MSFSILVAGATGLIGSEVVRQAMADPRVDRVIALVRRPIGSGHPKLVEWMEDGDDLLTGLKPERVDAVICCLGTTIRTVGGDKSKFIHVDKDLVLGLGRWAKAQGVPFFAVVSAMGADARSRIFYNRVKGEMEDGLRLIALPHTAIFQPSILTGGRTGFRLGERIGIGVMTALAPLIPADFRPMNSTVLARAILNVSGDGMSEGVRVFRYRAIVEAARI